MSIVICMLMVTSVSASITQNAGQPRNHIQSGPSPTSGGSGGLADSPWPMFRQNLNHTGLSPYDTSGNNGQLKWDFQTGDRVSSPAIGSDGTIYVGSRDNNLYAINSNGTEKWNFTTTDSNEYSSPAIGSDGTIYTGFAGGKLYAINPDGTEKWNFITGAQISSSPSIDLDGTIYIGSDDDKLYAINPDGTEKWNYMTGGFISGSPSIDSNGTIYIGSDDDKLYAINPDGTEKWNFVTGDGIMSSPAIGSDGTIYIGSDDYKLYAINPDGTEKWSFMTNNRVFSSPAIGPDGTIYIGSNDHKLYAITPDGIEKWNFTTGYEVISSPAIGSDGTIFMDSFDYNLYAINPDGTERWKYQIGRPIHTSSPAIDSDGTIYVGSWWGKLYAIGTPTLDLEVSVTSHFSSLNSAAQSSITVHVTDGTNPVQGATVNLVSDNGGIFSPQSGITDTNGDFKSIFNAPTVTTQMICRITAQASKAGYNDGSGYVDVTINPIPWPMFRQNLNHTGVSPYDTGSNPGKLKWSFQTKGRRVYSPVIGTDDTIYVGSWDNNLYAINPDGTEKWNFSTGNYVKSAPAIDSDGTIYVGSFDHNLYAINSDGIEKWHFTTGDLIVCSPTIGSDGTIYFGSYDNKLYALYPNGTEKWNFITGGDVMSSPAIGPDGIIYVGSSEPTPSSPARLYAINPDGTEKWNFMTNDDIYSSPMIGFDGTVYIGSFDHKLYAINSDGSEKWNYTTGDFIYSSPAYGIDGTIYIGSYDYNLYAINPDGTQKWNFATGDDIHSSPAIGADGTIYVGSDNNLYAINPDGTEKWKFSTSMPIYSSSPAIGSDGTIYVGSWDGKLYAIGEGGTPPVADAGPDLTVNEGDIVQFDGSGSYAPNGTIDRYEWDFDADFDSDGDGDPANDVDATGPAPTHVYGDDGVYNVTLTVKTRVEGGDVVKVDQDCVLCMDSSGSMNWNDPANLRIAAAQYYVDKMTLDDRGAVVDFDFDAFLVPEADPDGDHLSSNYVKIITNLGQIDSSGGTGISTGMNLSNVEIRDYGDPAHVPIIILLTDAQNNDPIDNSYCLDEANISAGMGIKIFTIGLNINGSIEEQLLRDIADITDGKYYPAPDASNLEAIYEEISIIVENLTSNELSDTDTMQVTVNNVAPTTEPFGPFLSDEGSPLTFPAEATDPGSDDLTFTWEWDDGTSDTVTTYFNNGIDPEPVYDPATNEIKSPWGTYPFLITEIVTHNYGDDGIYSVLLTIEDDDGGVSFYETTVTVNNVAPTITLMMTYPDDEGSRVTFEAESTDPGSDDVTYSWELEYGPTIENTFYNNGASPEPVYDPANNEVKSPTGTYPFHTSDVATHIYGDNYDYTIILTVTDDDGGESIYTATVTVDNLAPSILEINIPSDIEEGSSAMFEVLASDQGSDDLTFTWDFELGPKITNVHYNDGVGPDLYPSPWGNFPFDSWDTVNHAYGDDGVYTLSLSIEDDDGGITTYSTDIPVRNVAPTIDLVTAPEGDEGSNITFSSTATDQGSDDMTFTWNWGDGTLDTINIHYNDGIGPDPTRSPLGAYPFTVTDTVSHIYGDDGNYTITLTVEDDDGGLATYTTTVTINNVAPTIEPFGPFSLDEGLSLELTTTSTDSGSDDLTFTWEFELGPTITNIYYNDGLAPDPYPSPLGTFPFSVSDVVEHAYGDDGFYSVTLTVTDDDGGSSTYKTNITVYNVAPTIVNMEAYMYVNLTLRVAGEKYHSVGIHLYEENSEIWTALVTRQPGSPDAQAATITGVRIDLTKTYSATVDYLPNDPRVNGNVWGGNPVWMDITFENGSVKRLHHTFNVRQSYWDSDHWNHIDPWEVELNPNLVGYAFKVTSHITDPGSDDIHLTYTYGSQIVNVTYLNNPPNPDLYPSPEVNPVDIIDTTTLVYEGPGTVILVVKDDDNIRLGIGEGIDYLSVG